ncbi:MAG: protein kinase [Gemmataceae bacterium]
MQCPRCKQVLSATVRFCPNDGTPLFETSPLETSPTPAGARQTVVDDLHLPAVIGGRYRLVELRGGGGMAKVYRAVDERLDREVAVKLMSPHLRNEPEFDARFEREARIASQLADPHIVVVHDFGLDPAHGPFLVMEYLHGQSLRERMASSGVLPYKAVIQVAGQLLLALIHAHGKGIVHRDIKPDNIFLLNQSGVRLHLRVLDFGIARIYAGEQPSSGDQITHVGAVLGTPRYMSPEQLAGQVVDQRSDLYSSALVLFESLTGQLPYLHGKRLHELCPEVTPAFQELVDQCLQPNPADRPSTALEVYLRLQELGKASGILLLPPGSLDRLVAARQANASTVTHVTAVQQPSPRRRWLALALAALVLLPLGILGWVYLTSSQYPEGPETLHQVHLGEERPAVEKRLGLTREFPGNPWINPRWKEAMGRVLRPDDLPTEEGMKHLLTMRTPDERITVIFHQDRVVAVISEHRSGKSARGVALNDRIDQVFRRYRNEMAEIKDIELPDGHVEVRRYPLLGIGFEVRGDRVESITLFPPHKQPAN